MDLLPLSKIANSVSLPLPATSSKDDLHRRIGGRCSTNNMKVVFKVCCGGGGGGGVGDTLMIGESNRTSPARGNTKKALAATTPQPSVKVWSVPSSPAVVSHRPTINQPVVLQNDFVMTPVQNHSYSSSSSNSGAGGPGSGSSSNNWQSSTAATKKTLKPSKWRVPIDFCLWWWVMTLLSPIDGGTV